MRGLALTVEGSFFFGGATRPSRAPGPHLIARHTRRAWRRLGRASADRQRLVQPRFGEPCSSMDVVRKTRFVRSRRTKAHFRTRVAVERTALLGALSSGTEASARVSVKRVVALPARSWPRHRWMLKKTRATQSAWGPAACSELRVDSAWRSGAAAGDAIVADVAARLAGLSAGCGRARTTEGTIRAAAGRG